MGYTTEFKGEFTIDRQMQPEQVNYINKFSATRRMKRNSDVCARMPDPAREAVGLPVGPDGCYFTGGLGFAGQDDDSSIVDYNTPPGRIPISWDCVDERDDGQYHQPDLWCGWVVGDDGQSLVWNGAE